ncbi:MAG: FAD:protein FMN transferase [Firmicutes bacterium]|nr:FAD:protein FMN transferase [Bacillota bacterium]
MLRRLAPALVLVFVLVLFFISYTRRVPLREFTVSRFMMDTYIQITVMEKDPAKAAAAIEDAFSVFKKVEDEMNFFSNSSLLSRLNKRAAAGVEVPEDIAFLIRESIKYGELSGGAYDITVGSLMKVWPFGESNPTVPDKKKISGALKEVGFRKIKINGRTLILEKGMEIDLSACDKGYAVDKAIEVLQRHGITSGMVNAGGNLKTIGVNIKGKPWFIGVQHPRKKSALLATLELDGRAVATSGDYQRFFFQNGVRYHHLLDPYTGYPARRCISATILAPTACLADILSTAVFVLGPDEGMKLLEKLGCDGIIVTEKEIFVSKGLQGKIKM